MIETIKSDVIGDVIEYNPKYKEDFIKFNKEWIVEYFGFVEKDDIETFENIEKYIKQGSMIFMSVKNNTLLAGCLIKKENEEEWEVCKLCSNKNVEHKGAGTAVVKACLDYAIKNGAKRIYIISNRKLKAALHIYEKLGFREIKMDDYRYDRGDIALELLI